MENMLEIKDLHVYYDNIHALKGISLNVKQGEIVSLIGANGAGKTTTLQTISGLIQSKQGNIMFEGKDITKEKSHKICEIGITIKDTPENLEKDRAKFYEVFPRMSERKNQMAGTLSGGEQQMLAMGRAIMSRPKLLILDEPSMGLSPLFVKEIFAVIKKLNEAGTTILLVEQNAKMALSISHRAYVIETGNITLEGNAKELMNNPEIKKAYLGA